jgi:hypothetical protein
MKPRKTRKRNTGDITSENLSEVQEERVRFAMYLLEKGFSPSKIACALSWREFESLVSAALKGEGFSVKAPFYTKGPRSQIDILAEKDYVILCIDCKHFMKQHSMLSMESIAWKQVERAEILRKEVNPNKRIVPVIVTLREDYPKNVSGVPVVPVNLLQEFLNRVTGLEEEIFST